MPRRKDPPGTRRIKFPPAFSVLATPSRYKVLYGGRGSGKSFACARFLLGLGYQSKVRVLCAREIQRSINDSVHKLLSEQIAEMGLDAFYSITRDAIRGANGTEFIFKGLRSNPQEIKSTEGVNYAWIEEAQAVSEESWEVLIPTIRQPNSEIWLTFNPLDENDPTYQRFVVNAPESAIVRKVNYDENPYFPDVLRQEMEWCKERDYQAYKHIWEGEVRQHSDAVIFAGHFRVESFETPARARFYQGADWGFAKDPTALIRCFMDGRTLYVDREAWGVGIDLDETPALFDTIETARKWPIKADSARPETISFMKRRGFPISAARKWQGSVEDGIEYLKSLDIVIHPRCRHTIDEFNLYSYKRDKQTDEVLPVVVDANNHCLPGDALIACAGGEKPIKDVRAGDMVYTRRGLREVLWSGETRHDAPVVTITAGGYSITATPDHRIYTDNRGWVAAGEMQKGDVLLCRPSKQLLPTVWSGTDTPNQSGAPTVNITSAGQRGSTATHGSGSAGQSPKGCTYITKTATAKTTQSKTLNVSASAPIVQGTRLQTNASPNSANTLKISDRVLQSGTGAKRGLNGTENTRENATSGTTKGNRASANNVERPSRLKSPITVSAQTLAKANGGARMGLTTKSEFVSFVGNHSPQTNTAMCGLAPVPVDAVSNGGMRDKVYDLTVDGEHEFFANGVLVHNCIDAIRYALDGQIHGRGHMKINNRALFGSVRK